MPIKSDVWITKACWENNIITPWAPQQKRAGMISYGVTSYGYDLRVADRWKVWKHPRFGAIIDPKAKNLDEMMEEIVADYIDIPPQQFVLCQTVERVRIPRDHLGIIVGKSTYARCGIIVNTTPIEPEWEGYITIELSNTAPLPVRVYANEGIGQLLFFEGEAPCAISYADKGGKYQNQAGIELPKVD